MVRLVHTRLRGSLGVPGGQALGQVQGVGGAAPPGQKEPGGHTAGSVACGGVSAHADPAGQGAVRSRAAGAAALVD